jgi:TPR repeat protein
MLKYLLLVLVGVAVIGFGAYRKFMNDASRRAFASYYGECGQERDVDKAFVLLVIPADFGEPEAQYLLGLCYYNGEGTKPDLNAAIEWWRKAAARGSAAAQYELGVLYQDGEGVTADPALAASWFRQAAENNHPAGQYEFGNACEFGIGTTLDLTSAAQWYHRAAEQGDADAQIRLGHWYSSGKNAPVNIDLAIGYFRAAAEQEMPEAWLELGKLYAGGSDAGASQTQAWQCFARAEESDDPAALRWLAAYYRSHPEAGRSEVQIDRLLARAADIEQFEKDRPEKIEDFLKQAAQEAAAGAYPESYRKFLWYYRDCEESGVAMEKIRSWRELFKQYTPARLKLAQIVREKMTTLLNGEISRTGFVEIVRINEILKQDIDTVIFFQLLKARYPDQAHRLRFFVSSLLRRYPEGVNSAPWDSDDLKNFEAAKHIFEACRETAPEISGILFDEFCQRLTARLYTAGKTTLADEIGRKQRETIGRQPPGE